MGAVLIGDIVGDALGILGEVLGSGVNTYSFPRMIKDAGRSFNFIFKKRWWEQYTDWTTIVLDGATGTATTNDFTQVIDFEDFFAVCPAGSQCSLPTLPKRINPNTIHGTAARYYTAIRAGATGYAAKRIKVFPIVAVGSLDILARFHPLTAGDAWAEATQVHLDRDLLAYGTAFMALSGDDLNPGAKGDVQEMMDNRYKDIMSALSSQTTSMSNGRGPLPNDWFIAH